MTREEYMKQKASELRNQAHSHSLEREMPSVPHFDNTETEEEWQKKKDESIKYWEDKIKTSTTEGAKMAAEGNLSLVKNSKYDKIVSGASCINTYTDNYSQDGINRCVSGTQTFTANPTKYGFSEITQSQLQPGDMVLDYSNGTPYHALMYDSTNDNGQSLYNYSRGGDQKEDIVKQGKYKKLDKDTKFYTFVGTPEDQYRWSLEYIDQYIRPHIKMEGISSKPVEEKLKDKITLKRSGGQVVPKHAKGNPINTNPLPEMPINTNPVPEVKPKKKKLQIRPNFKNERPTPRNDNISCSWI